MSMLETPEPNDTPEPTAPAYPAAATRTRTKTRTKYKWGEQGEVVRGVIVQMEADGHVNPTVGAILAYMDNKEPGHGITRECVNSARKRFYNKRAREEQLLETNPTSCPTDTSVNIGEATITGLTFVTEFVNRMGGVGPAQAVLTKLETLRK